MCFFHNSQFTSMTRKPSRAGAEHYSGHQKVGEKILKMLDENRLGWLVKYIMTLSRG